MFARAKPWIVTRRPEISSSKELMFMWVAEEVSPLAYAPNAPSVEMRYVIHSKALHFVARNQVSNCYVNLFQQALARLGLPISSSSRRDRGVILFDRNEISYPPTITSLQVDLTTSSRNRADDFGCQWRQRCRKGLHHEDGKWVCFNDLPKVSFPVHTSPTVPCKLAPSEAFLHIW
jgi:hypothetical protein